MVTKERPTTLKSVGISLVPTILSPSRLLEHSQSERSLRRTSLLFSQRQGWGFDWFMHSIATLPVASEEDSPVEKSHSLCSEVTSCNSLANYPKRLQIASI